MVKHCAICGTLNEEFATSCMICEADLSSQLNDEPRAYRSSTTGAYFSTQSPPENLREARGSQLSQLDPVHSLSLHPYVATASMAPPGDSLLGPEEVDLSLQPLAVNADFESPAYPGTWVGGPALNPETSPVGRGSGGPQREAPRQMSAPQHRRQEASQQERAHRRALLNSQGTQLSPVALLALSSEAPAKRSPPPSTLGSSQSSAPPPTHPALAERHAKSSAPAARAHDDDARPRLSSAPPAISAEDPQTLTSLHDELDFELEFDMPSLPPQELIEAELEPPNEETPPKGSTHDDSKLAVSPPKPPQLPQPPSSAKAPPTPPPLERADRAQDLARVEPLLKVPALLDGVEHISEHSVPALPSGAHPPIAPPPLTPRSSETFDDLIFQEVDVEDELDEESFNELSSPALGSPTRDQLNPEALPKRSALSAALTWLILLALAVATPFMAERYLPSLTQRSTTPDTPPSPSVEPQPLPVSFTQVSVARPSLHRAGELTYRLTAHLQSDRPLKLKVPKRTLIGCITHLEDPLLPLDSGSFIDVPIGCTLALELPAQRAPFGVSLLPLEWHEQRGEHIMNGTLEVTRPYELSAPLISTDGARLEVPIALSPGWSLLAAEGAQPDRLYLWSDELSSDEASVTFSLISPQGQRVLNILHPVRIERHPVTLELLSPVRGFRTLSRSVLISGVTAPRAQIMIDSQPLLSDESGFFEGLITLPNELGEHTLTLQVQKVAHDTLTQTLRVQRISKPRWRAQARAAKRRLKRQRAQYSLQSHQQLSSSSAEGTKVRLRGEVAWIDRRGAPGTPQHLLLFTCAPASCPVWAQAEDLNWVKRGDQVELLGRQLKPLARATRGGERLSAPAVRVEQIAPR